MALQLSLQFPPPASLPRTSSYQQIKSTPIFAQPKMIKHFTIYRITRRKTTQFTVRATTAEEEGEEDNPQANSSNIVSETQSVSGQQSPPSKPKPQPTSSATRDPSELGSEIRKAMRERDGGGGGGEFWGGVGEEIREIEWPAFGKVLGTTGVVLAVIAGSSVVLLTVNAVLAELSDRIFAGKGVQDFFG